MEIQLFTHSLFIINLMFCMHKNPHNIHSINFKIFRNLLFGHFTLCFKKYINPLFTKYNY